LCVGSFEPRKNQIAVLYAAETLWREGHKFRVRLIGGTGWGTDFNKLVKRLRSLGRHITVNHAVSDGDLERAFRSARFSIFASLHEGYGLPVAESLAFDLPVITANYGSTAEIAASGGALLIDPRDDIELTQSMRDLLTDDKLLAKLRSEMHLIGGRTWDDYSRELWHALVEPERREVQK
jgi:glycosyltransferase involved in cell wall biosynthesis